MPRRFHHGLTDSTNERAFAALAAGEARHMDVHVACGQSAGRGRHGNVWHSEEGTGLYASVVLLPATPPPPAALTVAGGLAALDAVRAVGLAGARLEWPNDLMVGAAKLGGVLVETRGLDPRRPSYVLGVGLNVSQTRFPEQLGGERGATSLLLEGLRAGVPEVERALLDRLGDRLEQVEHDPQRLARDYVEASELGRGALRATTAQAEITGRLVAFALDEGLVLRDASGASHRLALEFLRSVRPARS